MVSPQDITTCGECGRKTPARHKKCVYCSKPLAGGAAEGEHHEPRTLGADKKRFVRQSDDRGHYLLLPAGEPLELDPGKLFVMGRDPRASLIVHSEDVSRQHAEIDWDDKDPPRPLLAEVRSLNGTFLNADRVSRGDPQPLRSGDMIRLGSSFTALYLHVTPRELKQELQDRGRDETRSHKLVGAGGRAGADPAGAREGRAPGETHLGELVAAALGEVSLTPVEEAGDFAKFHGQLLIKRLYAEQKSGVLTVFDGTVVGEMVLIEGRCRHAILGVRQGRDALEYVAKLGQGAYRFREEDPEELAAAPPPAEVDENGLSLTGDLSTLSGSDLVRDLVQRQASGVLTVFGGAESGQVLLEAGVCQEAVFGRSREREALGAIVRMDRGVYRFRPGVARRALPRGLSIHEPETWSAPKALAPPPFAPRATAALRPADDEHGVLRRSGTPVRPPLPGPLGGPGLPGRTGRMTRPQRPPLPGGGLPPPRRRPPPPPKPR